MKTTPIPVKFDRQGHSCNFFAGFGPTVFGFVAMRCLRALRLGRVGLDGVFGYFGVQRASMRMRGGAARLLQQWRCSYFGRVGGAAFCNSCWSSALLAAGGSAISVVSAGPRFAIHVGLVHFLAGGGAMLHLGVFLVGRIRSVCEVRGWFWFCSILARYSFVARHVHR